MPSRNPQPNQLAQQILPLMLLAVALLMSNSLFTVIGDETLTIDAAMDSPAAILGSFLHGAGQHRHPPLYDLIFSVWLRATGGVFEYLRIPSILFFVLGLFLLARVARRLGGSESAVAVVWLGALWPFGFQFGRLATWHSFSFLLVSGLTLCYLGYMESQTTERWVWLAVFSIALVWTNYYGWAILACLALDQFLRWRAKENTLSVGVLLRTAAVTLVAAIPLFRAMEYVVRGNWGLHHRAIAVAANLAFNVYSLFVSESVAPWYWAFSIPAGLAALFCIGVLALRTPPVARRFLFYSALLIVGMALLGVLNTKRLLLIAPWVVLPLGLAMGTLRIPWLRLSLAASLLIFGGIGWFGIYAKRYYSAPQFIEPWQKIAEDTAAKIQQGATLVTNSPSLVFYLSYLAPTSFQSTPGELLPLPPQKSAGSGTALSEQPASSRQIFLPDEWLESGHTIAPKMIWIRGMGPGQAEGGIMDQAASQFDRACGARSSRRTMRDEGYRWKQRFFPELGELPWRIEVREYDCAASASPNIITIPLR